VTLEPQSLTAVVGGLFATPTGTDVVSAYLFGSRIEGRAHRESDVDLAVLLSPHLSREERFEMRLCLTSELIAAIHLNEIDVVVLNDAPPLFARRIVIDGKCIYCTDAEADHAFRRDIQLRAADLEPFIERGRRALLVAIRQ
jgi:predicted nucleotidyltransferase